MAQAGLSVTVRVVHNRLPNVSQQLAAGVLDEVKRAAFEIEAAAKAKAAVRTGTMRRSIHSVFSNGGLTAVIGPSVSYAIYIEMGTARAAARPFMRPAAALVYPRFVDRMKSVLRGLK